MEGIVLWAKDLRIYYFLNEVRKLIVENYYERKIIYGHSYWTKKGMIK